ncbi:MAG: hypothetical protein JWM99_1593 [Verrucomicrobiales bacterium]|nr:hypothetical protein [Verrucomicrobiales bacterium]
MSFQQPSHKSALTHEAIVKALSLLSDELAKEDVMDEVCLFGGTVMVLAFKARLATKGGKHETRIIKTSGRSRRAGRFF